MNMKPCSSFSQRHLHLQMKAHLEGKLADAGAAPDAAGEYVDALLMQTVLSVDSVRSAIKSTAEANYVSAACAPVFRCRLLFSDKHQVSEAHTPTFIAQLQAAGLETALDGMLSGHSRLFYMPCTDAGQLAADGSAPRRAAATQHTCDAAAFDEYFRGQVDASDPQTVRPWPQHLPRQLQSWEQDDALCVACAAACLIDC